MKPEESLLRTGKERLNKTKTSEACEGDWGFDRIRSCCAAAWVEERTWPGGNTNVPAFSFPFIHTNQSSEVLLREDFCCQMSRYRSVKTQ